MPGPLETSDDMKLWSYALKNEAVSRLEAHTTQFLDGKIDLATWTEKVKADLRWGNLMQFVTGKGGDRSKIGRKEYLQLGPELAKQYKYLAKFVRDIKKRMDKGESLEFMRFRTRLYGRSTQAMFWRTSLPRSLPQVPRDGKTQCGTNCKCDLDWEYIRETALPEQPLLAINVYWRLGQAEHCEDCVRLSREWNPYRIDMTREAAIPSLDQAVRLMIMGDPELGDHRELIESMLGTYDPIDLMEVYDGWLDE